MAGTNNASSLDDTALAGLTQLGLRTRTRRSAERRAVPGARFLLVLDCAIMLALLCAVLVASNLATMPQGVDDFLSVRVTLKNVLLTIAALASWGFIFRAIGLYVSPAGGRSEREGSRIFIATGLCAAVAGVFPATSAEGGLESADLMVLWLAGSLTILFVHSVWHAVSRRRRTLARQRVLVVGTGPLAVRMLDILRDDTDVSYEVVGFIDSVTAIPATPQIARRTLATIDSLEAILMQEAIDEVFVALPAKSCYREIHQALRSCERVGVSARYRADLFETEVAWPTYEPGSPMVTMQVTQDDYRLAIKRAMDATAAAAFLVLLAPVMALIALAIKLESRGPIFYVQERYGRGRRRFRMAKFRTMVPDAERLQAGLESRNEADGPVFKIAADPRVTRLGRLLRRTSLDELPQFFNVLKGDMSLVGPRPLPVRDVARFTDAADMRRFSVRPGLTCLWQISGRSNLSFNDWMRLDLSYIDGWSLELDLLILARTLPAVLRGTGAR
jgi:exopolysaccharide biosynthesis polyprenyl glycosylphosphotransferase